MRHWLRKDVRRHGYDLSVHLGKIYHCVLQRPVTLAIRCYGIWMSGRGVHTHLRLLDSIFRWRGLLQRYDAEGRQHSTIDITTVIQEIPNNLLDKYFLLLGGWL